MWKGKNGWLWFVGAYSFANAYDFVNAVDLELNYF